MGETDGEVDCDRPEFFYGAMGVIDDIVNDLKIINKALYVNGEEEKAIARG